MGFGGLDRRFVAAGDGVHSLAGLSAVSRFAGADACAEYRVVRGGGFSGGNALPEDRGVSGWFRNPGGRAGSGFMVAGRKYLFSGGVCGQSRFLHRAGIWAVVFPRPRPVANGQIHGLDVAFRLVPAAVGAGERRRGVHAGFSAGLRADVGTGRVAAKTDQFVAVRRGHLGLAGGLCGLRFRGAEFSGLH